LIGHFTLFALMEALTRPVQEISRVMGDTELPFMACKTRGVQCGRGGGDMRNCLRRRTKS
jgi:hypothetical protein